MKLEMERRRTREEDEEEERRLEREERDRNQAEALKKQLEEAEARYMALKVQMEQERRDHEIALRLAAESRGGMSAEDPASSAVVQLQESLQAADLGDEVASPRVLLECKGSADKRPASASKSPAHKFDLSKWKYAELRDTINTSCDIELLEACREEFHRRLKVYHAWKAKNRKKNNSNAPANSSSYEENARAPNIVLEEAAKSGSAGPRFGPHEGGVTCPSPADPAAAKHRYFRIPFVRSAPGPSMLGCNGGENGNSHPAHLPDGSGRGWWYAHFDGPWIGRQMEVHEAAESGRPILLVAGQDDINMCELSLEETGLTRRRGAEILPREFEDMWAEHGGPPYVAPTERRRSSALSN